MWFGVLSKADVVRSAKQNFKGAEVILRPHQYMHMEVLYYDFSQQGFGYCSCIFVCMLGMPRPILKTCPLSPSSISYLLLVFDEVCPKMTER